MAHASSIYRVAVPVPLSRSFDYLPPTDPPAHPPLPGTRLLVPFGPQRCVGILLAIGEHSELPRARLKAVLCVLDPAPLIDPSLLALLQWAARYYVHPLGEVLPLALPVGLREPRSRPPARRSAWRLSASGRAASPQALARAPVQRRLHQLLSSPHPADAATLATAGRSWRQSLRALLERGWVEALELEHAPPPRRKPNAAAVAINTEQRAAIDAVRAAGERFGTFLIDGVTGSGKTEVYLQLIEHTLARGRQVLVLVPEIGLTPQLLARFEHRLDAAVIALHSAMADGARLQAWRWAQRGEAQVVIGTRSAVFCPLPALGLIVVDEEHDPSFKQQEGLRYHGRDLALVRAREARVPILLGSATPSAETLKNAADGKYHHLKLLRRAGGARAPAVSLLDIRRHALHEGLSEPLLQAIEGTLAAGEQALVFINRRGFAPVLMCEHCGEAVDCQRCDAHLTWHRSDRRLHCHHCAAERPLPALCEHCGEPALAQIGQGTERIEDELQSRFPAHSVLRVDRDSTRRQGALASALARADRGEADILVGTQMLAKGHHFPRVTLVAVLDADGGLYRVDYRATEVLAQTLVQVAGRAGRGERPGRVIIQTRLPEHPLLNTLIREGYPAFASALLAERAAHAWPPYARIALLRAESVAREAGLQFLAGVHRRLAGEDGIHCYPPNPAPMERRAGRYRAQLLVSADSAPALINPLSRLRRSLEGSARSGIARWSIDIDPVDLM